MLARFILPHVREVVIWALAVYLGRCSDDVRIGIRVSGKVGI